ncbi:MAG: pyridoxal 5'-phosphate synthase glutaminase subunit PdxT [Bacilli bacterium]
MKRVGVLALQGAFREHMKSVQFCGAEAIQIKKVEQLDEIDALILPGGESTAMRRLMDRYHFIEPLRAFAKSGKPMFGTCAGMILLASEIEGYEEGHLKLIDMRVRRNAFGRQVDSFEAKLKVNHVADDFEAVFIRAPLVLDVGPDVEVLCTHNEEIVAVQQGNVIATSFHPELTDDHRLTKYLISLA